MRGGLGNQMFQFAYAYSISKNNGFDIVLDAREYSNYYWPFGLKDFVLSNNAHLCEMKRLKYDFRIKKFHIYQYLRKKITNKELIPSKRLLKKGFVFSDIYCPSPTQFIYKSDLYLYGYFQDVKYLLPIKDDLINFFSLKHTSKKLENYLDLISDDSIAVSMRFAEKIELSKGEKYIYSDAEYYSKAINHICNKKKKKRLVIMSNNLEKAKKILENVNFLAESIFIEGLNAQEQIEVFKKCNDFVISNSTFAWWGAFLGSNGDSIVVAPRIWYQGTNISNTHLFFKGMEFVD